MFSQLSTDNLLDNLESEFAELTELVEFDSPKSIKNSPLKSLENPSKKFPSPPPKKSSPKISPQSSFEPPIPAKRNFFETSPEISKFPVPAVRKNHSLDKKEKNDENEIIQMSALHSDHASVSSDIEHISRGSSTHSVINFDEKKKKNVKESKTFHESQKISNEESFFVVKHGKWADDAKNEQEIEEIKEKVEAVTEKAFKPALEVINEKTKKRKNKKPKEEIKTVKNKIKERRSSVSSMASNTQKTNTESSSLEESPQPKRKVKKSEKKEKKSKKKTSEEITSATTQASSKRSALKKDAISTEKSIRIFINNTGPIKYAAILKGPRIKISIFNEDNGKQIGESYWTKVGTFNNDFYNLICTWNDSISINLDLTRLRELYNNVLIFFEMINSENLEICWAFLKFFSPNHLNADSKFKLQFFEYQKDSLSCFGSFFKSKNTKIDLNIFEQWQLSRKKLPCILNIFVKDMNHGVKEEIKSDEIKNENQLKESLQSWRKIPGQPCKIPNKIFHKIPLHDKGSMMVKFSHDGSFLGFTEVSRDGYFLHIHKFPEMIKIFTMGEHSNFIHDIDWMKQKNYATQRIVTASSDFTAIIWKLEADSYTYTILPHPGFVYASKFLYKEDFEGVCDVVTAGRDSIIRIWRNRPGMQSFELIQELKHPMANKFTYITTLITRNAETFYTSSSTGDIIEWTLRSSNDYHLNRKFILDDVKWKIINNMDLNPRGNKIYFRIHEATNSEIANTIFVLGVPTGEITQKMLQFPCETQGVIKVTPCGTQIFSSNKNHVRFYHISSGNLNTPMDDKNFINFKLPIGEKNFITSMDYHPKDFYFACSIYGYHGSVVICSFESDEKISGEVTKFESQEILNKSFEHQDRNLNKIIRRLDEVFLSPVDQIKQTFDENTFTVQNIESKRSKTYTVSQGPATFTINKGGQNDTYEIQRNDNTDDDDTTISQSLN